MYIIRMTRFVVSSVVFCYVLTIHFFLKVIYPPQSTNAFYQRVKKHFVHSTVHRIFNVLPYSLLNMQYTYILIQLNQRITEVCNVYKRGVGSLFWIFFLHLWYFISSLDVSLFLLFRPRVTNYLPYFIKVFRNHIIFKSAHINVILDTVYENFNRILIHCIFRSKWNVLGTIGF